MADTPRRSTRTRPTGEPLVAERDETPEMPDVPDIEEGMNHMDIQEESPSKRAPSDDSLVRKTRSRGRPKHVEDDEITEERIPAWKRPDFEYDPDEDLLNEPVPLPFDGAFDDNDERIMIENVFVENFKSYLGKHSIGPFHKNLTIIMGPNGSGKSNVIDALLFVFGFRGNRIRSKKLSSLIHSSSALNGKPCNYCRVAIDFTVVRESDNELIRRINITRTAYQNDKSIYTIDGKTATLKEVEQLLIEYHIDLIHNRFLILQGEVEAIAMMKPVGTPGGDDGMIEFIDDIIGSNRYCPLINKLEKRFDDLQTECTNGNLALREREKDTNAMVPLVHKSIKYICAANEVKIIESTLKQLKIVQSRKALVDMAASKVAMTAEIKAQAAKVEEAKNEVNGLRQDIAVFEKRREEAANESLDVKFDIKRERAEHLKKAAAYDRAVEELKELEEEHTKQKALIEELSLVPLHTQDTIDGLEEQLSELTKSCDRDHELAGENLKKFDAKAAKDIQKKKDLAKAVAAASDAYDKSVANYQLAKEEIDSRKMDRDRDTFALTALQRKLEEETEKLNIDKEYLNTNLPKLDEHETAKGEVGGLKERMDKLKAEYRANSIIFKERKSRKEQRFLGGRAQKALMKAKAEGVLPGIIGRLGDLAAIDDKYNTACCTMCGQLEWVVVELLQDGKDAINFLTNGNLPRTTFLTMQGFFLEKTPNVLRSDMRKMPVRTNVKFEYLYEHIRCNDERVKKMICWFLSDVIVVEKLADGHRLPDDFRNMHRIVTYDGSVIDRSGSVTGGGRPYTGRIGNTINEINLQSEDEIQAEIRALTIETDQMSENFQKAHGDYLRKVEYIRDFEEQAKEIKRKQKLLAESIPTKERQIESLRKSIRDKEKELETDQGELDRDAGKQKELEELGKVCEQNKLTLAAITKDLESAKGRIDKMFSEIVTKVRQRATDTEARKAETSAEIAKHKAALKNYERNMTAATEQMTQIETQREKLKQETQVVVDAAEEPTGIATMVALAKNRDKKYKEYSDDIAEKRRRINVCNDEREAAVNSDYELNQTMKRTIKEEKKTDAKIKELQLDIQEIRLEKVPDMKKYLNHKPNRNIGWNILEDLDLIPQKETEEEEEVVEEVVQNNRLRIIGSMNGYVVLEGEEPEHVPTTDQVSILLEDIHGVLDGYDYVMWTKYPRRPPILTEEQLAKITEEEQKRLEDRMQELEWYKDHNRRETTAEICTNYKKLMIEFIEEEERLVAVREQWRSHGKRLTKLKMDRLNEFTEGLMFIGDTTRALYQLITDGGDARLKFVEEGGTADPFITGIKFNVRPAKKSWKSIENLSGGEKTLASLCFVFALHHYKATPLYVMDEIDAALDGANVRLIAEYIKQSERTKNSQFIIVSLRHQMYEVGNRLIGIYKTNDCTHNVVIDPSTCKMDAEKMGKPINDRMQKEKNREKLALEAREEEEQLRTRKKLAAFSIGIAAVEKPRLVLPSRDILNLDRQPKPRTRPIRNFPKQFAFVGHGLDDSRDTSVIGSEYEEVDEDQDISSSPNPFDDEDADMPPKKRPRRVVEDEESDFDMVQDGSGYSYANDGQNNEEEDNEDEEEEEEEQDTTIQQQEEEEEEQQEEVSTDSDEDEHVEAVANKRRPLRRRRD